VPTRASTQPSDASVEGRAPHLLGADDPLPGSRRTARVGRKAGLAITAAAMVLSVLASLALGAKAIPIGVVLDAFLHFDGSTDHLVVRELRLPRTLVGMLVGASLGVAGAAMQAITRNPLADPGLLGVNAGAALAVVVAIWWFGIGSLAGLVWFAFLGAAVASIVVFIMGSLGRGGATPVRLALAGAAMTALLVGLTSTVLILDQQTLDAFRFWMVGSLAGRDETTVVQVLPFVVVGLLLALSCARALNALGLGEEAAAALGTRIGWTRAVTVLSVTLLCGAATAACGPIVFIGLVVPLAARAFAGPDQRWLLSYSLFLGPAVLLTCDVIGRVIARPGEVQVGITTAAIGGPVFVWLVRRTRLAQL
jgi:iron complex transport system permease protein